jgi:hypothetical protein
MGGQVALAHVEALPLIPAPLARWGNEVLRLQKSLARHGLHVLLVLEDVGKGPRRRWPTGF